MNQQYEFELRERVVFAFVRVDSSGFDIYEVTVSFEKLIYICAHKFSLR